jgi:hypothetical protein
MTPQPLRIFAYGGGVQSTAALVLAAQGKIDFKCFLFANVGDDSEDPWTLAYVEHVAKPFAAFHGVELHELRRTKRDGTTETLLGRMTHEGSRSLPIPVRMSGGHPAARSCTADFKIRVMGKWAKAHGASADSPAIVGLGISQDEAHRVNARKAEPHEILTYPLIGFPGDRDTGLRLRRSDCEQVITDMPLPPLMAKSLRAALDLLPPVTRHDLIASDFTRMPRPPKSACWFCPWTRPARWKDVRRERPVVFFAAAALEETLSNRQQAAGKGPVFMTGLMKPLREVIRDDTDLLPFDDDEAQCDNGWCMTLWPRPCSSSPPSSQSSPR